MLSEQEFYLLNGNQYRGSRYANFSGAGVDAQGNVSSAINENAANQGKGTSVDPTQAVPDKIASGVGATAASSTSNIAGSLPVEAPRTLGGAAKDMVLGAGLSTAGSTLGGVVGANLASGNPAFSGGMTAVKNRLSAGLLGSGTGNATATNAALGSMGKTFGPATQASVTKAAGGGAFGSAAGVGLSSAASTLLTGGSVKDAAISGIGSGVGFYVGNMLLPVAGGPIGSLLGSMVGGLFGGGEKRQTIGARIAPDDQGRYKSSTVGTKGVDSGTANKYVDNINKILNSFGDATGIKYKDSFSTETNIGKKDQKTMFGANVVSSAPGDAGAVALGVLKNPAYYDLGSDSDFNNFWQGAVSKAQNIGDLGKAVDDYYASRGLLAYNQPNAANIAPTVNRQRRYGDRAMTFYG